MGTENTINPSCSLVWELENPNFITFKREWSENFESASKERKLIKKYNFLCNFRCETFIEKRIYPTNDDGGTSAVRAFTI